MKKFLFGLAALPFIASVAVAAEKVALSDVQMDGVTAGSISLNNVYIDVVQVPIGSLLFIAVSDCGTKDCFSSLYAPLTPTATIGFHAPLTPSATIVLPGLPILFGTTNFNSSKSH